MHSTTALSGGFRYRPTTSVSFSSKRLSLESLKVFTRCGCSPRAHQIRCTVAGLTPCDLAIDRQLQCVSPCGLSCSVACTIAATFSAPIEGLRPRPSRTRANFASPSAANRSRHAVTLAGDTPSPPAIAVVATPSAASSSAFARVTSRCGAVRDRARLSRTSRWPSVIGRAGLAERIMHPTIITTYLRDTTLGSRRAYGPASGLRHAAGPQAASPAGGKLRARPSVRHRGTEPPSRPSAVRPGR